MAEMLKVKEAVRFSKAGEEFRGRIHHIKSDGVCNVSIYKPSPSGWIETTSRMDVSRTQLIPTELIEFKPTLTPVVLPQTSEPEPIPAIASDYVYPAAVTDAKIAPPTASQLKKINAQLPRGAMPFSAEEVVSVPLVVANNLVNRSLGKWNIESLKSMARLLVGKPAMLDHSWEGVASIWGRVYDTEILVGDSATPDAIAAGGNASLNRRIIKKEGYVQCIAYCFAEAGHPVVEGVLRGRIAEVSAGLHLFDRYECPECETSFSDRNCNHAIPSSRQEVAIYGSEIPYAPYSVWSGLYDMGEVSLVTIPRLPASGVIR
ncbi:MAG: hypothetical protein ACRC4J_03550 [Cetobacterium sp.]